MEETDVAEIIRGIYRSTQVLFRGQTVGRMRKLFEGSFT